MADIKKLLNSSTQINVLKRALHALALTQRQEQGINWNNHTLADLLNIEEGEEVSERAASTAIDKAKKLFNVSVETTKGSRNILSSIEDSELERELFLFYSNFIVSDQAKWNCADLINKKHKGKSLWIIARLYFASIEKKRVSLTYNALNKNIKEEYLIHPYHIVFNKNRFYLVALREKDGATGLFSLNRIDNVKVKDTRFSEDIPEVNNVFRYSFGSYVSNEIFTIEIEYSEEFATVINENFSHLGPDTRKMSNGMYSSIFKAADLEDICRELFYYGNAVEIKSPTKARDIMVKMLENSISVYKKHS